MRTHDQHRRRRIGSEAPRPQPLTTIPTTIDGSAPAGGEKRNDGGDPSAARAAFHEIGQFFDGGCIRDNHNNPFSGKPKARASRAPGR